MGGQLKRGIGEAQKMVIFRKGSKRENIFMKRKNGVNCE
jgi:hypothetical protein